MRLAMSILVRDEADIIEANIRHHAALGVARFIVTDNNSIDGTREILERLSREYDLSIIDEPSLTIDQDLWVTRMAEVLKQEALTDWVINNDADEFWLTKNNRSLVDTINDALAASEQADAIGVLYCPRHNYVSSREAVSEPTYRFIDNAYRVRTSWTDVAAFLGSDSGIEGSAALLADGQHVVIRTLPGKVITKLDGLARIDMGNHGAEHALAQLDTSTIEIAHYPIRSFEQFKRKVVNYGSSIENNDRFGPQISLHLRRWYQSYREGRLEREYELIVLPNAHLLSLVEIGVLAESSTPAIQAL